MTESDMERAEESSLDAFALALALLFVATGCKHAFWDWNDVEHGSRPAVHSGVAAARWR